MIIVASSFLEKLRFQHVFAFSTLKREPAFSNSSVRVCFVIANHNWRGIMLLSMASKVFAE